jgi:hypothetical protein
MGHGMTANESSLNVIRTDVRRNHGYGKSMMFLERRVTFPLIFHSAVVYNIKKFDLTFHNEFGHMSDTSILTRQPSHSQRRARCVELPEFFAVSLRTSGRTDVDNSSSNGQPMSRG